MACVYSGLDGQSWAPHGCSGGAAKSVQVDKLHALNAGMAESSGAQRTRSWCKRPLKPKNHPRSAEDTRAPQKQIPISFSQETGHNTLRFPQRLRSGFLDSNNGQRVANSGGRFGFTSQVKASDFGEMAGMALFSSPRVFASSLFNCGIRVDPNL
jgi:hypothetical protein